MTTFQGIMGQRLTPILDKIIDGPKAVNDAPPNSPMYKGYTLTSMEQMIAAMQEWRSNPKEYGELRPGQYLYNCHHWEYKGSYEERSEGHVYGLFQEWLYAGQPPFPTAA